MARVSFSLWFSWSWSCAAEARLVGFSSISPPLSYQLPFSILTLITITMMMTSRLYGSPSSPPSPPQRSPPSAPSCPLPGDHNLQHKQSELSYLCARCRCAYCCCVNKEEKEIKIRLVQSGNHDNLAQRVIKWPSCPAPQRAPATSFLAPITAPSTVPSYRSTDRAADTRSSQNPSLTAWEWGPRQEKWKSTQYFWPPKNKYGVGGKVQ